jgi:creatinine amidohydrolase
VAKRVPDDLLLMPHLSYGFNWHHIDFPGTIGIGWDPYVRFILDIAKSVAHHGFRKMIIVNGHGSNRHLLELVTRQATMDNDLLCAGLGIFALGRKALRQVRESPVGWSSHADEIETSLYLHLRPEGVRTAEMQPENSTVPSKYHWRDIEGGGPLVLMEWWSTFSHTGVLGDPTKATAEKGKIHFDAIVEEMADLIHEFKDRPIRPREDHH